MCWFRGTARWGCKKLKLKGLLEEKMREKVFKTKKGGVQSRGWGGGGGGTK